MQRKRPRSKRTKTTVRRRQKNPRLSASTMEIPIAAVFESMPAEVAAHLEITCPGMSPLRLPLSHNDVIVGRDASCDVTLPISNVSRKHSQIVFDGEEYVVEDRNSTNGTFVNNVRIDRCVLRDGDVVRIGEAKIRFAKQRMR